MPIGIRVTDLPAAAGTLDDDDEFLSLEDGSLRRATRAQAGPKAAIVQVADTANQFTGTNVETVLAEIQDNVNALVISGGGIAVASEAEALAGTDNTKAMTPLRVKTVLPWFNVKSYGATGDGVTDDTAAIQAAINEVSILGGTVLFPEGDYVVSTLLMKSQVTLSGASRGQSRIIHKASAGATDHCIKYQTDSIRTVIRNLTIHGNKTNQTNAVDGIHLNNSLGTPSLLGQHLIENVFIESCKGNGITLGAYVRSTVLNSINIYTCDAYGMLISTSDSQVSNVDIGQSGLSGVFLNGASFMQLINVKSWLSGRLNAGTDGSGFRIRNCAVVSLSNCGSQESKSDGITMFASAGVSRGNIITGFSANSDNVAAGSYHGMNIGSSTDCIVEGVVSTTVGIGGTPVYGLQIAVGCAGCLFRVTSKGQSGLAVYAPTTNASENSIVIGRGYKAITYAASLTPDTFTTETFATTLTGPLTVNAPTGNIAGTKITFVFTQDATGGHVVTWNAIYKVAWTPNTAAGKINVIEFVSNGTNWVQVASTVGI